MSQQQYMAKTVIQINGKRINPKTVVKMEDEGLMKKLLKSGAIVEVGSPDAISVSLRSEAKTSKVTSTKTEKKDEKPQSTHKHKFDFTAEQLDGKSLDELNAMIVERDNSVVPYEEEKEARAHLMMDAKKN